MSDNLPAKYAKTVQLLQKKKEELEQVFEEARALESENSSLLAQNRELRSRNVELESATKSISYEFATLEAHVKKQQSRLQHYIDLEASGHGSNRPRAQDAAKLSQLTQETSELRKKNFQQEETIRKLDEAQGRLQSQVDTATEELKTLRKKVDEATAGQKNAEEKLAKTELRCREVTTKLDEAVRQKADYLRSTDALERVEAEALDGLRQEIVVLTEDNNRLLDQLDSERSHLVQLRTDAERFDDLVRKQRYLSEGQLKIARDEIASLNAQNESLLVEVKRLIVERDQLKRKMVPTPAVAPELIASPTPKRVTVVEPPPRQPIETRTVGTMTTDVFHGLESMSPTRAVSAPVKSPVAPTDTRTADLQATVEAQRSATRRLETAVEHLEITNEDLRSENEGLRGLLREKDASVLLLEEKNRLLTTELPRVHQASTALERLVHRSPSQGKSFDALVAELDEVDKAVGKTLVLGTRAYRAAEAFEHTLLDTTDGQSSCSETDDGYQVQTRPQRGEGFAVPVVPCDAFREPILNHIMEKVGGLRHIVKRLWTVIKSQTKRHQLMKSTPKTNTRHATDASAPCTHHISQHADARPVFDLDAWLADRRQEVPQRMQSTPHTSQPRESSVDGNYTAGTTLTEVVEELRRSSNTRYRRR